jgi:hypothetical protein
MTTNNDTTARSGPTGSDCVTDEGNASQHCHRDWICDRCEPLVCAHCGWCAECDDTVPHRCRTKGTGK